MDQIKKKERHQMDSDNTKLLSLPLETAAIDMYFWAKQIYRGNTMII